MSFCVEKIAALFLGLTLVCSPGFPQSDPDREWTDNHVLTAFEDFFPVRYAEGDFIAVRSHQSGSNEAPEFSFVLENTQDPRAIRATLHVAQGASLYRQLAALHAKDPAKAYADLKPELKVQSWTLSIAQCPAVLGQFSAFQHIQFIRPRDDDEVGENPVVYEISETVAGGSSQVIEYIPSRAIPRWAVETHKALLACAALAQVSGGAESKTKSE